MIKNILKTIVFILVIIIIILIYLFKTFDINKYKPTIEYEMSKASNQSVKIGDMFLDFSFSDGVLLKLQNMKMSGSIADQMRNELMIKEIVLTISVKEYLANKRIVINS